MDFGSTPESSIIMVLADDRKSRVTPSIPLIPLFPLLPLSPSMITGTVSMSMILLSATLPLDEVERQNFTSVILLLLRTVTSPLEIASGCQLPSLL